MKKVFELPFHTLRKERKIYNYVQIVNSNVENQITSFSPAEQIDIELQTLMFIVYHEKQIND